MFKGTVLRRNKIVSSPHYAIILSEYNRLFKEHGKVNKLKFFDEFVSKKIPNITPQAWYGFVKKFEGQAGLIAAEVSNNKTSEVIAEEAVRDLAETLRTNKEAEAVGINNALNVGAALYEKIASKYLSGQTLTQFEESCLKDVLFKAMKAQDSRIHAIGKVREDHRQERILDQIFTNDTYSDE